VVGLVIGRGLAHLAFRRDAVTRLASHSEGFVALAATLVSYGATEVVGGYGFLAVFVAAVTLRQAEQDDEYHQVLHDFAEQVERLLAVGLLVGLGAAVAGGLLAPLDWRSVLVAVLLVLLVRPVAGWVGLLGSGLPKGERVAVAFFGIRGIGSLYYLAHALEEAEFTGADALWALVALVILISLVLHGVSVSPVMRRLDARTDRTWQEEWNTQR
jgi:NhaP-type Na+/H+ or K+/H+ antiporter